MREKSKKTVRTRLLSLLLVFCMTFQMVSYSPGNVVRAEGEEAGVSEAEAAALADNTPLENKVYLLSMGAANPVINGELEVEAAWPPFLSARLAIGAQSGGYTKESPNVAFKLDLALDDDYLGTVLEKHQYDSGFPNDPTKPDYQQQLTDFFQKNETIQPVILALDLGDEFDASTFETINGAKENELQNSTGTKIGSYTVQKIDGQAKLVVTFEKLIYGFNSVKAGLSFQLGLKDSAFAGNKPVDVEWDNDNAQINVFEWKDPNAPGPNDRDYEVGKRVVTEAQPNPDPNAPITEVETPYLDYEIKVSANPDNQEGADKQALTLADKIFEDMIPSGLQVSEVKLNGTKLEQATYSIENGKFSYTFPNDSTAKTATFWIRLALSAENYKNFLTSNNFNQTFTNTASLHSLDSTMPVWASDPVNADIKMTLISKDGQQLPEDGTKIQWTININTHFTNLGEAYLVDSISTNDQNYDFAGGIHLKGVNSAGQENSWEITKSDVVELKNQSKKYEELEIEDLVTIGKQIGNKKAGWYEYGEEADKKAVLVIPYNPYTNQKVTLTYNTNINTDGTSQLPTTDAKALTNEAKLLWNEIDYPGIGPKWHPDNWAEIEKPAPVVASLVSKKGGDYDEDTHIMNWSFTTNRYNVDINKLTITDVFTDSHQLLLEEALTYSKNGGETEPLTRNADTDQPYYAITKDETAGTTTLVIHCPATMPKNDYYTFNLQTEVKDPAFLAAHQAETQLSNEAAIHAEVNGKRVDEKIKAQKDVANTLIEKSVKTPYNYNTHEITWDVTINPHHVPLSEAVVTDDLPVGNTFVSLDNVKRINAQGDTVESTEVSSEVKTIGLTNGINLSWKEGTSTTTTEGYAQNQEIFTFNNKNDTDTYVLTLTTEVSDDKYRQAIFSTNDKIEFNNKTTLNGEVLGKTIENAVDTAADPAKSTVVDKSYEYDKANGLVTWTVVMNTNGVDVENAKLEEKLNPVFEMDTDKNNFHFYKVKLNDNGSFTKGDEITDATELTTLKNVVAPLATDGFTFAMPETYKSQAIALTFQTYILDDIKSGEVTNTVTFGKDSGGGADKTPQADATFNENFNIDDYAQIAPAPLIMVKKESSNGPIPLENATFTMERYKPDTSPNTYSQDKEAKTKTYNTRSTGKATFLNIKKDYVYKLTETKAPAGYTEVVPSGESETHYFMFVKKNPIVTFFTGAGIQQKKMTVDSQTVTVDLIPTTYNSYTYTKTNVPTGSLEFTKNGADNKALKDAEFTLTRDDGQWKENTRTATSDTSGKVSFDELDPGVYTLKETKAPDLYTELTGTLKVNVDAAGAATITKEGGAAGTIQDALSGNAGSGFTLSNGYVSGTIKVHKVDEEKTDINLAGAEFKLYKGTAINADPINTVTTGSTGIAEFKNVPYDPAGYTIVETKAPAGYERSDPATSITITGVNLKDKIGQDKNFTYEVDNVTNKSIRKDISLTKKNNNASGEALQSINFKLVYYYDKNNNDQYKPGDDPSITTKDLADNKGWYIEGTTDSSGELTFSNVPYGSYTLEEVSDTSTRNYKPVTIEIPRTSFTDTANSGGIQLKTAGKDYVENTLKTVDFKILKTDNVGDKLSGVKFTLDGKNAYGEEFTQEKTTQNGIAAFTSIPVSQTTDQTYYTLTETTTDTDGYAAAKEYRVYVTGNEADGSAKVEIRPVENGIEETALTLKDGSYNIQNTPVLGTISFTKKDTEGRTLVGVPFKLERQIDGEDTAKDDDGQSLTNKTFYAVSDNSGVVTFNNVPYANYTLTEVDEDGKAVSGVQSFTPENIAKADLEVISEGSSETFKWKTTEVTNTLNKASVTLTKKDQAGIALDGVEFTVKRKASKAEDNQFGSFVLNPGGTGYFDYYKSESEVLTATSASGGKIEISNLAYGAYKLVETSKPADIISAVEITFNVDENGKVTNLNGTDKTSGPELKDGVYNLGNVENTRVYGQARLTKTVTGTSETLSGVPFKLYKYTGDAPDLNEGSADKLIADNLTTGDDGVIDTSELEESVINLETKKPLNKGLWTGKYYFLEQPSDSLYCDNTNKLVEFEITAENHYVKTSDKVEKTMSNDKFKTNIQFTKYDTTDNNGIEGVSFTLKRSTDNGTAYTEDAGTITTGENGIGTAELTKKGQYQLTETVPEGYDNEKKFVGVFEITDDNYNMIVDLNQRANWTSVADESFTDNTGIANDRLPGSMTITKVDADDNAIKLNGAAFTLYQVAGDENETAVLNGVTGNTYTYTADNPDPASAGTNEEGKLIITNLPWGNYKLVETTAPEAYQLQQTPVTFTVDTDGKVTITNADAVKGFAALSGDKVSLSFANTLNQGNITFIKHGTNDENDLNAKTELSGAVFGLYMDAKAETAVKDANGKAITAASGPNGTVTFNDIYVGTYYVKEITAPANYTADSTVYQTVIDKDGKCDGLHAVAGSQEADKAVSEITNEAVRGSITISKTDSFNSKPIKGIEFTLTKKDSKGNDIKIKTGVTDENGKLVFDNLLMDTEYGVRETKTLSGYVLSPVTQNITLKTGEKDKNIAFTNDPTKLTFKKVDTTGAGLAGAEFTLYEGSTEKAKATSGEDGMVTFLYLDKGRTYTVKETKRPGDDYLLNSTEFKAVVDNDGTCTLKNNDETVTQVVNADAGVITLNKKGNDNGPLSGVTFELKNEAGEVIQTQITGDNGQLVFADVPMGSYTIVETAAPDPYAVSADVTKVTLSRGASQKVTVSRVNALSQVVFHKRGIITETCAGDPQHAPLEGAVYGLYKDPECAAEPVYTAVSGNPGDGCKVVFTGVARGTWYVKEITAPQHYMLDTTVYKAVVDSDGHFDGLANLDDTKVADNRVVDAAVTTDIVLKKVNEQKPDEVLPGSTYGLFKKAAKALPAQARSFSFFGTESAAETEDESEWQQIAEATTGQDGYLRFEGVLMGVEYSIRELKAPEGSHVSEKPVNIKFGINEAGEPVIESIDLGLADPSDPNSPPTATVDPETGEIVWLEPSIVAEISKTDMNANLLAGARLRITVKDGSGVYIPLTQADGQPAEWVSGEQPETFVKLMKIGKDYRLEEIEAPSGYKLAAPVDFTVRTPEQGVGPGENLTEQVVLKNELTSFFISKTTINGTDELPGAVLAVYETAGDGSIARDEDGNEIVAKTITGENLSWISGKEMKKIEGLPAGTYVLREITAPDGYEVAEEISFTLMPDGTVTVGGKACVDNIVRMQDKPAAETGTPDVPDKPQTPAPDHPDANNGAATGIAGSVSPTTFWGVLALLSVAALLVCSVVVWRRKRW